MVNIVAGVIKDKDKILICKRPKTKSNGLLWEFAGGKVEKGESLIKALERECLEEINVKVKVNELIMETEYVYPDITVLIHFFYAEIIDGDLKALEHSEIKWIEAKDLSKYNFCSANKDIIEFLGNE